MQKNLCSLFPTRHCGALELGVRCFSANISLLKSGNFYRGVIPSVPTILALTGSPLYPKAAILCTYLFYLLALFTPYPFPVEVLLPALLCLELCYSLCSTASYCKSIQQLHKPYNWTVNSQQEPADKPEALRCELGMVRQLKTCLLETETEAKDFSGICRTEPAELNQGSRLIFVLM